MTKEDIKLGFAGALSVLVLVGVVRQAITPMDCETARQRAAEAEAEHDSASQSYIQSLSAYKPGGSTHTQERKKIEADSAFWDREVAWDKVATACR